MTAFEFLSQLENQTYLRLGITPDGSPVRGGWVPWQSTANAFNMKTPQVFLSPEDLQDPEILHLLAERRVVGFYAFAPLEDYSVLSRFDDLMDLYLEQAEGFDDPRILRPLKRLRMLYLEDATLPDAEIFCDLQDESPFLGLACVGLWNCRVGDLSAFDLRDHYFSEFLVWMPEEAKEQYRWTSVNAGERAYFEYVLQD